MNSFLKEIKDKLLVYDGSKGTMLNSFGLKGGECPELWNVTHVEEVRKIYTLYKDAGANVIQTNTFQGNRLKLKEYNLEDRTYELNYEAAKLAKEVMGRNGYVAASIGPIGMLLEPSGELTFELAFDVYKEQVKAVVDGGVDIINFETFTDVADIRAALLAAREVTNLPVICSVAFETNGKTLMGTDPYTTAVILKSLGADMIGTNCSFGPEHILSIVKQMSEVGGIYLSVKPNAGLPELIDGEAVYSQPIEKFAELSVEFVKCGARLIGGCCGTTPDFIKAVKNSIKSLDVPKVGSRSEHIITSGVKSVVIRDNNLNIGYMDAQIDSGLFKELKQGNLEFVVEMALEIACESYDAIYVNVDAVEGDKQLLAKVVNIAQGYLKEPFIIESSQSEVLSNALKLYRGKAGVIVGGYDESQMEDLIKVSSRFGSTIVDRTIINNNLR